MQTYILKRLLLSIPMLFGITFISFVIMNLAPGDPGGGGKGEGGSNRKMTADQRKVMYRTFHLDQPLHLRYLYWMGFLQEKPTPEELEANGQGKAMERRGLIYGDFGYSMEMHSVPVRDILARALPITILLNVLSLFVIYLFSIPLGIFSATQQGKLWERIIMILLFMLYSMPNVWISVLLIKMDVMLPSYMRLPFQGIQPGTSSELTVLEWLYASSWHLILPLFAMTYASFASMSRYMRSGMIDIIRADFIRTARAKGLKENLVIYKHALRNSLIPIITLLGSELPGLIGGSVIIETIFGIPGMGYVAYKALLARDYTVLMADLTLVSILVMAGFLLSDLLYKAADPRISFE